jgi:hypothetical protein
VNRRNFLKAGIALAVLPVIGVAESKLEPIKSTKVTNADFVPVSAYKTQQLMGGEIGRYEGINVIKPDHQGGYMTTNDLHQQLTQAIAETSNKHVLAALKGGIL